MNNRILELMEQAMELVGPYALEGEFGPGRLNEKKFSQLIVRECANYDLLAQDLKTHFGVEE